MKELKKFINEIKEMNPYSSNVFLEPDSEEWKGIGKFLTEHGKNPDRIFAKWGRMVWRNCIKCMEDYIDEQKKEKMKTEVYSKKQSEALLNDTHRKQLLKKLFELYANSSPIILKKENGDTMCIYSDEVEELAEKIREDIKLRDKEICDAHN